jgi:hypothetical protein
VTIHTCECSISLTILRVALSGASLTSKLNLEQHAERDTEPVPSVMNLCHPGTRLEIYFPSFRAMGSTYLVQYSLEASRVGDLFVVVHSIAAEDTQKIRKAVQ